MMMKNPATRKEPMPLNEVELARAGTCSSPAGCTSATRSALDTLGRAFDGPTDTAIPNIEDSPSAKRCAVSIESCTPAAATVRMRPSDGLATLQPPAVVRPVARPLRQRVRRIPSDAVLRSR